MSEHEAGDSPVVEPITGAIVAKVAASSTDSVLKSGLLERVLGPAADELGEALQRFTAFRTRNVGRIIESADRRSKTASKDFRCTLGSLTDYWRRDPTATTS